MKLLVVAFANSVHTAKWINLVADEGWDIHLFPCVPDGLTHPLLRNVTIHHHTWLGYVRPPAENHVVMKGIKVPNRYFHDIIQKPRILKNPYFTGDRLIRLIKDENFDLVHSLELRSGGDITRYAKNNFKKRTKKPFPKWWATNWGSEIQIHGNLKNTRPVIDGVLHDCDFFSAECQRDVKLAIEHGLDSKKVVEPIIPVTGGFEAQKLAIQAAKIPTSKRKKIIVKGYQTWSGRALFTLKALEECADLLKSGGFEVDIYSGNYDVEVAAELTSQRCGVPFNTIPKLTPHEDILALHSQSRVYIAASIGDGISTSLLEAMACGAFPIQSNTSCACEWVEDGKTAYLTPPEDVGAMVTAIRKALTDDELVNSAASKNIETIQNRADRAVLKKHVLNMYENVTSMNLQDSAIL
jgi:glycosyltransferase involved in cell wall biosynthesis